MTRLLDSEILAALRYGRRHGEMTYVLRNILAREPVAAMSEAGWMKHPTLSTAQLRYRLLKLEREGAVRRVRSTYMTQICWALPEAVPA